MKTNCWRRIVYRRKVVETNSSGDELLETNCVETNSSGDEK